MDLPGIYRKYNPKPRFSRHSAPVVRASRVWGSTWDRAYGSLSTSDLPTPVCAAREASKVLKPLSPP